jgi:hypothetical protein
MFTLKADHLKALCELNEFPVDADAMVFVGLRGCLPVNPGDQSIAKEHGLMGAVVDYLHPRCALIQWTPKDGKFAVFPGSTVPHRSSVEAARRRGGVGANQLLTGYYDDYRKGWHKAGKPTGHEAWRQTGSRPIRRTADDLDYEEDDRVEISNPADNFHSGWCAGLESSYSSAGCQVLVGFPKCARRGSSPATGPWRVFHDRGYAISQSVFGYALFNGGEAKRIALTGSAGMKRVRFGSNGPSAKSIQKALKAKGFFEGTVNGAFDHRSLRALLEFQEAEFGRNGDDGICGPQTAEALGVDW